MNPLYFRHASQSCRQASSGEDGAEADPVGARRGGGVMSLCKRLDLLPCGLLPSSPCTDTTSSETVASSRSSRASAVIGAPPTEPPTAPLAPLTALQNAQPPADAPRADGGRTPAPAPAAIAAHAAPTPAPAAAASAPGGRWLGRLRPPPAPLPPSRCCCMAARAAASPPTLPCISPG